MNSRAVKIAVSLLLTVSLLCCSVSVFADDPEPNPSPTVPPAHGPDPSRLELQLDFAAYIIWQVLDSWGINFDLGGVWEFTDAMENWIIQFFLDYCLDLGETAAELLLPWAFDYDIWGNMRINDTALRDIQDFAQWLINKYALSDDSSIIVGGYETVSGVTLYETDTFYEYWYSNGALSNYWVALNQTNDNPTLEGYFVWHRIDVNDNRYYRVTITRNFSGGTYYMMGITVDSIEDTYSGVGYSTNAFNQWGNADNFYYLVDEFNYNQSGYQFIPKSGTFYVGTAQDFANFILNAVVRLEGNNRIVTGIIALPTEDPNYNIGDSMIIVDGNPDYQLIEWDGHVTVDNLPAIISTGTIENPEVDQIYTNIPAFFQMANDTMYSIKQIVYRMPDEVLICIYAVLAVGVLFGFLRIMREH